MTENFRKVAAHEIGLESARRGEYNAIVRGFVDAEGRYANAAQREAAYARAFTYTTQFEFGKVGKALMFQGGAGKRLAFQFRSWQSNMIGLYGEMLRQKDYRAFAKGMTALMFLGGPAVAAPLGLYDHLRKYVIRQFGYALPNEPLYHGALKLMGLPTHLIDQVQIRSLSDPFGFDPGDISTLAGPTLGGLLQFGKNMLYDTDKGKTYKIPREIISSFAPQVQDALEAAQEYWTGGVMGPGGMIDKNRPLLSIIARGLDLQPSIASQRAKYEDEIEQAYAGGHPDLAVQLINEMREKNLVVSPDMQRRMRAFIRGYQRSQARPWEL